jgi:hypothetical protein
VNESGSLGFNADPLTLFGLDWLPKRFVRRLAKKSKKLGPQLDPSRDRRLALARAEEIRNRRIGAFGLGDTRTGAASMGLPPVAVPPGGIGF